MKKDRNCGGNMYPTYQMNGMMPMQGGMPMPYQCLDLWVHTQS